MVGHIIIYYVPTYTYTIPILDTNLVDNQLPLCMCIL